MALSLVYVFVFILSFQPCFFNRNVKESQLFGMVKPLYKIFPVEYNRYRIGRVRDNEKDAKAKIV